MSERSGGGAATAVWVMFVVLQPLLDARLFVSPL